MNIEENGVNNYLKWCCKAVTTARVIINKIIPIFVTPIYTIFNQFVKVVKGFGGYLDNKWLYASKGQFLA